jgi:hypothetical protein
MSATKRFIRATRHRSQGTELYSKGFDMRRKALLSAKALVHSLSLAVLFPILLLFTFLDCSRAALRSRFSLSHQGLGAESRAAVRDLNTITSLARRIALIATNPHPPRNSQKLLAHLSEAAARARDRLHHYNMELDDSMLAQPQGHFTQALFHAEMLCARGEIFKVKHLHLFDYFVCSRMLGPFNTLRRRRWPIQKMRPASS